MHMDNIQLMHDNIYYSFLHSTGFNILRIIFTPLIFSNVFSYFYIFCFVDSCTGVNIKIPLVRKIII